MNLLRKRWAEAAQEARALGLGEIGMATLAQYVGMEWFRSRGDEPLSNFLNLADRRVMALRGFGTMKIAHLCEIVERANQVWNPQKVLSKLGIPEDFPCHLVRFSKRIHHFCEVRKMSKISELVEMRERLGAEKFLTLPQFGQKTILELELFFSGLRPGGHERLASFLPLEPSGCGLSLARALAMALGEFPPAQRSILRYHFVEQLSLSEAGRVTGFSRERVRQLVKELLDDVRSRLEYFSGEHRRLLEAWQTADNGRKVLCEMLPVEDREIIGAALEAVFRENLRVRSIRQRSSNCALIARNCGSEKTLERPVRKLGRKI